MSAASGGKRLFSRIQLATAWTAFYFLRGCERLVPPSILRFLCWPPIATWALLRLRPRKLWTCWRRFPESWHPRPVRFFLRQGFGIYHPQPLPAWPDRLCTPRWLSRCRLEGGSDLIGGREGARAVVLASMHFGPWETIPFWLRAHGIVATTLRGCGAPESLRNLTNYQYSLSAPADVPVYLLAKDMTPLPRVAHVRQLLGPGRRLLMNVDVVRGPQFYLPFGNRLFRMATGAIRLAAMADAELVPCLIRETGSWKFAIHFGIPVPRSYLGSSPNLLAAGAHLLEEFSKVISLHPEQCRTRLLAAICPLSGDEAVARPANAQAAETH
jgi:hypothetical protein